MNESAPPSNTAPCCVHGSRSSARAAYRRDHPAGSTTSLGMALLCPARRPHSLWTLTSAWPWGASSWTHMPAIPARVSLGPPGKDQRSMPFVDPATANNLTSDAIASIKHRNGSTLRSGTWRERISATEQHRTVLLHWPPGTAQAAHYHPDCEEVFVIARGVRRVRLRRRRTDPGQSGIGALRAPPLSALRARRWR